MNGEQQQCLKLGSKESVPPDPSSQHQPSEHRNSKISKRQMIVDEILSTELSYISSLLAMNSIFFKPLEELIGSPQEILSRRQHATLFSNFSAVTLVNQELYQQLQLRLEDWDPIQGLLGNLFIDFIPYLRIYSLYATNFNSALASLKDLRQHNVQFVQFIKQHSSNITLKQQNFESLLLMPVQRIPRYKMLLEELLKNTLMDHPDYKNLVTAFKLVSEVALYINETIRQHENVLSIIEIQNNLLGYRKDLLIPGRMFLKRGPVKKVHPLQRRYRARITKIVSYFSFQTC